MLRRLLPLALAVSCSSGGQSPPPTTAGPFARFVAGNAVPNYLDVPFPSDAYLQNGHVVAIPGIEQVVHANATMLTHALSVLDGFGRVTFANFYLDDPTAPPADDGSVGAAAVDATTLPVSETDCMADGSAVFLVDLSAGTRLPCRAVYHVAPEGHTRPVLGVGPARGVVLLPAHRYAAGVTTRVKTQSGAAIGPSADFAKIAGGDRSAPLGALYGTAYDTAQKALALGTAQIAALAVFTTHDMEKELFALRDELESAPAATLAWDGTSMAPMGATKFTSATPLPAGFTASLDAWLGVATKKLPDGSDDPDANLPVRAHDAIDAIGTAVFQATSFLQVRSMGYLDPDHATFARDASGHVIPAPEQPTVKIWVTLFTPKTAMPASGYPVVIAQHGLSASRDWAFQLANTLCKSGWVVAAIDSVTFGARAPEPTYQVDQHSIWASAPGATYDGPDGLADLVQGQLNGSGDLFGNLLNVGALRDQFRQAEFDTAQLVKVLRSNPDLSPLQTGASAPKIDPTRVAYVGNSLGAIQGSVAAALEPSVNAWMLNVSGGGIVTELAVRSPVIGAQLNAAALQFGFLADQITDTHPLATLIGTVAEPGDPLVFASSLVTAPHTLAGGPTKPRNLFQVEALYDEIVTNEAAEAIARAAGLGLGMPNVGSNAENPDVAHPEKNPHIVPFPTVMPDATGAIHDTPMTGVTAVLMQVDPATHSDDLTQSTGGRTFKAPWALYDTIVAFPQATHPYTVREPYLTTQAAMVGFFASAFGGQVPVVAGLQAPVRDLDDDGNPDATDPDPNDPNIH